MPYVQTEKEGPDRSRETRASGANPRFGQPASGQLRHPLSPEEIREVNTRYHDVAADHYDHQWGIDFGELGHDQVLAKVRKALHG